MTGKTKSTTAGTSTKMQKDVVYYLPPFTDGTSDTSVVKGNTNVPEIVVIDGFTS